MNEVRIDALLPAEMAVKAEQIGVRKAEMAGLGMFTLAVLAGAFISLGALFATTISSGSIALTLPDGTVASTAGLPYGVTRLLSGLVFCLGLILVVVGGAELFTGNNLIVMAWASGKVSTRSLLRNWSIPLARMRLVLRRSGSRLANWITLSFKLWRSASCVMHSSVWLSG